MLGRPNCGAGNSSNSPGSVGVYLLFQPDERRDERQLSVISSKGTQAAFTGTRPDDYKGHLVGKDMVVAGNILVGRETLEAMAAAFESTTGTLADRVMAALEAGQNAGGDRRGKISAARPGTWASRGL
ncbi:MAG: DUF1028 domain-containing protein [Ramlibacter sp.]|nr:DUF1028 domain-containing protein [Ramlibacter sp.]